MATRGAKPKPLALVVATGSKKAGAAKPDAAPIVEEVDLELLIRPHPDWFSPAHIVEWKYILDSAPLDLLKTLDYNVMVNHVTAVVAHADAGRALRTAPMLDRTPNGFEQPSAYYSILNRQAEIVIRTAAEMGFTPTSRARVAPGARKDKPKAKDDPKKEFFG